MLRLTLHLRLSAVESSHEDGFELEQDGEPDEVSHGLVDLGQACESVAVEVDVRPEFVPPILVLLGLPVRELIGQLLPYVVVDLAGEVVPVDLVQPGDLPLYFFVHHQLLQLG